MELPQVKVKVKSLSHVRLFVTSWTVAYLAPPSMGFSRQESWSGLPFPSPGYFPIQGLNPGLLHCRQTLDYRSYQGISPLKDCQHLSQIIVINILNRLQLSILGALATNLTKKEVKFLKRNTALLLKCGNNTDHQLS